MIDHPTVSAAFQFVPVKGATDPIAVIDDIIAIIQHRVARMWYARLKRPWRAPWKKSWPCSLKYCGWHRPARGSNFCYT